MRLSQYSHKTLNSHNNPNSGFTLIEIMMATMVVGALGLLIANLARYAANSERQTELEMAARNITHNLQTLLNNPVAWQNTYTAPINQAAPTNLLCMTGGQCTNNGTNPPTVGTGVPLGGSNSFQTWPQARATALPIQRIYDSSGALAYDFSLSGNGFTNDGIPCPNFNGTAGAGTNCSLQYSVVWQAVCPVPHGSSATCASPGVRLWIVINYNPASQYSVPFNPNIFGSNPNQWFMQGGNAGSNCWNLAAGVLSEACGPLGVMTGNPGSQVALGVAGNSSNVGGVPDQIKILGGIGNANDTLAIGFDTTNNYGSIQAEIAGVGVPLILNALGGGGPVGIGTTVPNPNVGLTVNGWQSWQNGTGAFEVQTLASGSTSLWTNGSYSSATPGANWVNTMTLTSAGNVQVTYTVTAGTYAYAVSDINQKKDIVSLASKGSVLDKLQRLNGVYFAWKENNEKSIGLIAQNVNKEFPELADKKTDKHWTLNYGGLTGVVVEAVKELKGLFTKFEARLSGLEKEGADKDKRIRELERRLGQMEQALKPSLSKAKIGKIETNGKVSE